MTAHGEHRYAELEAMLAPAAGGVHVVSTGVAETRALQRRIYGAARDDDVDAHWRQALRRVASARVAILGVPSDTGAGFTRGANRAPAKLREHLLELPAHPVHDPGVVDVGDVRVVPHLLADDMLSEQQRAATREALYGAGVGVGELPVSPLDMCARVLGHLRALNPSIVPVVIGGDHSVGWPAFATAHAHAEGRGRRVGLLHFDAHTDLLSERLGVRYCFATWAYHANELLGRDGRLVQVGIRASGRDKAHWEQTLGVRQYWPDELAERPSEAIAAEIEARFRDLGVDTVYVSNDIDGTDVAFAAATGTPEPGGPTPALVHGLTRHLTRAFPMVGGDLVEVAPPLAGNLAGEPARTLDTACAYLADLVRAGLGAGGARARRASTPPPT
ncbi:arginase family protein [Haliangium sp.]|uniref:arginase family protein n=1 Tax=Haliangium sp. TaxID=2663208 RepID=UPI003D123E00